MENGNFKTEKEALRIKVALDAVTLCEMFNCENLCLNNPWEIRLQRHHGANITSYEKNLWEGKVNLNRAMNFMFYSDNFLKIAIGFMPTAGGGIDKKIIAIQTAEYGSRLVYYYDADAPENDRYIDGEWRKHLSATAECIVFLHKAFAP